MNALQQEVIPAIFAPLLVRFAVLDALGTMCKDCVGNLCVQFEQFLKHIFVIVNIVVDGDDDGIGEVNQSRNEFAVRPYVAVVVAYLEYGVLLGKCKETLWHFVFGKLCQRNVQYEFVGQNASVQQ